MDRIIYHAGCWDGFCAAWLASKAWPNIKLTPAHHGTPPPDVGGEEIILADFSYNRDVMLWLMRSAKKVTVLDHHKTAEAALEGIVEEWKEKLHLVPKFCITPEVIFDMGKSGGRLMWNYLVSMAILIEQMVDQFPCSSFNLNHPHWLVKYTEDRDLWKWELPNSREINAGLRSYPLEIEEWNCLQFMQESLIIDGSAILRREQQIIDQHVRQAEPVVLAGVHGLVVNSTVLFSDIAGELAKKADFGACWFMRSGGVKQWSLRSRGEEAMDVSEIAKAYGGGGHHCAAGFEETIK